MFTSFQSTLSLQEGYALINAILSHHQRLLTYTKKENHQQFHKGPDSVKRRCD